MPIPIRQLLSWRATPYGRDNHNVLELSFKTSLFVWVIHLELLPVVVSLG